MTGGESRTVTVKELNNIILNTLIELDNITDYMLKDFKNAINML